jgi:hypothetical protein
MLAASHRRSRSPRRPPSRARLDPEQARLRSHFRRVLLELEARDTGHLAAPQRQARAHLIRELARYARLGRFPKNLDFPGARVPYFVDAFGTRCAMAHLIEATGERAFVARIAGSTNNALVRELAGDLELIAWLERVGLTAAEAARIQPSYCFVTKADECLCNQALSPVAIVEGTVVAKPSANEVTVRVDAVHGDASVVMTGQEVTTAADAATGEVVLLQAWQNGPMMMSYGNPFSVQSDGTVKLYCNLPVPALKKEDAIDAMLATKAAGGSGDVSACVDTLKKVDARWGESQCEDSDAPGEEGGCSLTTPGAGSPLVMGTLLVAAAAWSRRGIRRRRRARN